MTSLPDPGENDTSSPVPDGEYRTSQERDKTPEADSSAVSVSQGPAKVVTVRGARGRQITVPYNVECERRRMENLAANGWTQPPPDTGTGTT